MKRLSAVSLSSGAAAGTVRLFSDNNSSLNSYEAGDVKEELQKFQDACKAMLVGINQKISANKFEYDEADIREAFAEILKEEESKSLIIKEIESGLSAKEAVRKVYEGFADKLDESDDELLRARAADLRALASDLFEVNLVEIGKKNLKSNTESDDLDNRNEKGKTGIILVSERVSPTKLLMSDIESVSAIVSRCGGTNDHTAIIARMRKIPYVTGVDISELEDGESILVDANEGLVIKDITQSEINDYLKNSSIINDANTRIVNKIAIEYKDRINILANVSSDKDFESLPNEYEGVGLLRLEAFYMSKKDTPSEDEIVALLESLSKKSAGKKVRVRTLDLGGDKALTYLDTSLYGDARGLALSLKIPNEFEKEVRAISSAAGNYEIMFPVVEEVNDLRRAVEIVRKYNKDIRIGIMTETKRGVENLEELLTMCDFVSIGTNDLTADILQEDRSNIDKYSNFSIEELTEKNESINTDKGIQSRNKIEEIKEVVKYIEKIIDTTHKAGKKVCICGEAASNKDWLERFISMGLDEISIRVWE